MSSNNKKNFEKDFPHGAICHKCATKKGGKMPSGAVNTCSMSICPYCKKETGTFAVSDYNWPKYRKAYVWD
jgi:hypothetical protein